MSLSSLLGDKTIPNEGEKKVRCPYCRKWIRVSRQHDDFVHKNCNKKWLIYDRVRKAVFRDELLAQGKSLLSGMLTEPPNSPKRKSKSIDKDERDDSYFTL